jgi:hypothetical protein
MISALPSSPSASAFPATTPPRMGFATCPSCRATHATVTCDAVENGADWQCVRCGQQWSATRRAAVATYAEWVSAQTTRLDVTRDVTFDRAK